MELYYDAALKSAYWISAIVLYTVWNPKCATLDERERPLSSDDKLECQHNHAMMTHQFARALGRNSVQ